MDSPPHLWVYAALLVVTGTLAPLINKYQDQATFLPDGHMGFFHPLFQTLCMFLGETAWIFASLNQHSSLNPPKLSSMFPPALCELFASVFQNLAIAYTFPSHVGVLGSLQVVFTALFSSLYLKRSCTSTQTLGISLLVLGSILMVLPSSSSSSSSSRHAPNPVLGDMFMLIAQIFRPIQYVLEEVVLENVDDVMLCVGWEGLWGVFLCVLFAPVFYMIPAPGAAQHLDSLSESVTQLMSSRRLQLSAALFVANVALYNWLGMTITKKGNSTMRSVLNSLRTASIWLVSLSLGWEHFHPVELVGFIAMAMGSSIYNQWLRSDKDIHDDEFETWPLVPTKSNSIL